MTTKETQLLELAASVQSHIADLTPDMIPIIERIEKGPMAGTTQHNYGGYMSALATLCPGNDSRMLYIICSAMIAAGGNEAGIKSACAINTGRDPLQAIGL